METASDKPMLFWSECPRTFERVADSLFNRGVKDARQRVTFHTLRHTFASWMAQAGTPLLVLKDLLGHKTLAMVARYAKLMPSTTGDALRGVFK